MVMVQLKQHRYQALKLIKYNKNLIGLRYKTAQINGFDFKK